MYPVYARAAPFCWTPDRGLVTPGADIAYEGVPLVWGWRFVVNDRGEAVGSMAVDPPTGGVPNYYETTAIPVAFRCLSLAPVLERLPLPPGYTRGMATTIGQEGTVYGRIFDGAQWITVRWLSKAGVWGGAEPVPEVPADAVILSVSRSGRLAGVIGASFDPPVIHLGRAFTWDPHFGLQQLSESSLGPSLAWDVKDPEGAFPFFAVGTVGNRAALWIAGKPPP